MVQTVSRRSVRTIHDLHAEICVDWIAFNGSRRCLSCLTCTLPSVEYRFSIVMWPFRGRSSVLGFRSCLIQDMPVAVVIIVSMFRRRRRL